ncbi:ATP-binding protein [Citromicrobium bathyomarinum]
MHSLPFSGSSFSKKRELFLHTVIGPVLGILILHPLTALVYGSGGAAAASVPFAEQLGSAVDRLSAAFEIEMLPMSLAFAVIGGAIGLAFGLYHLRLMADRQTIRTLEHELAEELPLLIARGEGAQLEFKSSLRWDTRQQRANRSLQQVVVRTIAGFLNNDGGTLLIGIDDNGHILGIEADLKTLKHPDKDGFERVLMDAIRSGLGGNACALVHCYFHDLDGRTICRVIAEKSLEPIYFLDNGVARFLLRAGNSTRELDARSAHSPFAARKRICTAGMR